MLDAAQKRQAMIEHLEAANGIATELNDGRRRLSDRARFGRGARPPMGWPKDAS